MYRTVPLLSRAQRKFLIPPSGTFDRLSSAALGMWSQITDPLAREEYERLVEQKIIKDTVLMNARHGSILTMALFHNLRNPLFKKYDFDIAEFLEAAGPAIEVFQDTLTKLVHQLAAEQEKEVEKEKDEESRKTRFIQINISNLETGNVWRQQAAEDPNSLAARLQNMVSESNFDDHYYGAKLFTNFMDARLTKYKFSKIGDIALVNARAQIMEDEKSEESTEEASTSSSSTDESVTTTASDSNDDPPVAACIEVLYEIEQTYEQKLTEDANPEETMEKTIGVAVFEGYLHGKGPTRWKIAMVREAFEF